jgi:hypothetical protein
VTQEVGVTLNAKLVCAIPVAFLLAGSSSLCSEMAEIPKVVLNVSPAESEADPGPKVFAGEESETGGARYIWADLAVEGSGDCRIYFDFQDPANFHFLDRRGSKASFGICEAGVEQIFSSGTLDSAGSLRLARHGSHMALFEKGKLVISAFDERLTGGKAGARMIGGGSMVKLSAESRDDIHFTDDFMITESRSGLWRGNGSATTGDFSVKSLKNPVLSANAFCYMGAGKGIYSVVGQPWWDNYRYDAALRGPVDAKIGMVFAFQDDKNYGLFRWTARNIEKKVSGARELIRIRDGKEEVLAQSEGGYEPDEWYAGSIDVTYSHVSVSIDGHQLLEVSDPCLAAGSAGVWCDVPLPTTLALDPKGQPYSLNSLNDLMRQHAVFDDVVMRTLEGYQDDFRTPSPLAGGWLVGAGEWQVQAKNGEPGELSVNPSGSSARALIGDRRWAQYEVETDVLPGSGAAGIIFLHRDESSYYTATVNGEELTLSRVGNNLQGNARESVVDSTHLKIGDGAVHLKSVVKHGHIKVTAAYKNGSSASVETFDTAQMLKGRAGLVAIGSGPNDKRVTRFSRFRVSFLQEAEPLITTNAVFEDEMTMNDWTNPTSEWLPAHHQHMVDGKPVNLFWHRSQFPGDVELMVEPRDIPEPNFEVALSIGKDPSTGKKNNGYVFRYRSSDAAAEGASRSFSAQIIREGETVKECTIPDDSHVLSSLAVRRCGKYIVALVNGQPVLSYRDESPLPGSRVAYYTKGVSLRTEATRITSDSFRDELFSRAPVAWRTAGPFTIAEVTNRWQCDPRWSFFSLKSENKHPSPAVLWSKELYPGDVTVECFVSNKMEGERGAPYSYARDINITICSDGSDLTRGYTFMFGGDNNTGSMIKRNGKEVVRTVKPIVIPTDMNLHRHWFSIKVEKHGSKLSFRVDKYFQDEKEGELVYEDPEPVSGNHIALWTYNHAMMISRIRVSGEGGNVCEEPGVEIAPLKCQYDGK